MPFLFHKRPVKGSVRLLDEVDLVIQKKVLPNLRWERLGRDSQTIWILPNGCPKFFPSQDKSHENYHCNLYFALCCRGVGLNFTEVGSWLDHVLNEFQIDDVLYSAEKTTLLRFDQRKLIYYHRHVPRSTLICQRVER